jgi:hypothetical protein
MEDYKDAAWIINQKIAPEVDAGPEKVTNPAHIIENN